MTRAEIEQALTALNEKVVNGKMAEAFEEFYHEEVSMQENELAPVVSKASNRLREQEFLNGIIEFRKAAVKGVGIGDNISFVIWYYDYTHKDWGVRNYTQVSIQQWKDGKIYKEQFVYGN